MKEKEPPSWKTLMYEFSQETTMHGVRYVVAKYNLRRIVWATICLAAASALTGMIWYKLHYLLSRPKNVNVEVTYTDEMNFPAVTVCNENLFRLTALQKNGLYDLLVDRLKNETDTVVVSDSCKEKYYFFDNICELPKQFQFGDNSHTYKMVEVTREVCKYVCSSVYKDICSSVLYDMVNRSCVLSAYTGDSEVTNSECTNTNNEFYRRWRCLAPPKISCDFETECTALTAVVDKQFTDEWKLVKAEKNSVKEDNTLGRSEGHYLYLMDTDRLPSKRARVITDFLNTTDLCLMLFYRLIGGQNSQQSSTLIVNAFKEDGQPSFNKTIQRTSKDHAAIVDDWIPIFIQLPPGIHQVALDAVRPSQGSTGLAVDDVIIQKCELFESECMRTKAGKDYMGHKSTDGSGSACLSWSLDPTIDSFKRTMEFDIEKSRNYCRNIPGKQWKKPYCLVQSIEKYLYYSPCDIAYCGCSNDQFKCGNGLCIPLYLTCNGEADCDDWSDEEVPCGYLASVSCTFDDTYLCGYYRPMESYFQWSRIKGRGPNSGSPRTDRELSTVGYYLLTDSSIPPTGKQTLILTPIQKYDGSTSLQFYVHVRARTHKAMLKILLTTAVGFPMREIKVIQEDTSMKWKKISGICLPSGSYAIGFLARTGMQGESDIALDDVSLVKDAKCLTERLDTKETTFSCSDWSAMCGYYQVATSGNYQWRQMTKYSFMSSLSRPRYNKTECGGVYSDITGTIRSPYYPEHYRNNMNCRYEIRAVQGSSISLTFDYFDVEKDSECSYDSVKIVNVQDSNYTKGPFCGTEVPPLIINSSVVVVIFKSDEAVTRGGFLMTYKVTLPSGAEMDFVAGIINAEPYLSADDSVSFATGDISMKDAYCLSIDIVATGGFRIFTQYLGDSIKFRRKVIYEDNPDAERSITSFRAVQFDVMPPDSATFNIIFEAYTTGGTGIISAVDNLKIEQGSCLAKENSKIAKSTDCWISAEEAWTNPQCLFLSCFVEGRSCGLVDQSPGPYRWTVTDLQYQLRFAALKEPDKYSSNAYDVSDQKRAVLVSPLMNITNSEHCLFIISSQSEKVNLYILLVKEGYSIDMNTGFVGDSHVMRTFDISSKTGTDKEHLVKLETGNYHIMVVAARSDKSSESVAIIETFIIIKTSCSSLAGVTESFDCEFSDLNKCGYLLRSSNGLFWAIPGEHQKVDIEPKSGDSKGGFMLLSGEHASAGDRSLLISPAVTVDTDRMAEVSFFFFYKSGVLQDPWRDGLTTLEVARFENDHVVETIKVFKADDCERNQWITAKFCLPKGEYRLAFIGTLGLAPLNSLAVDSISLLTTACQFAGTRSVAEAVDVLDCEFQDITKCGFVTYSSTAFLQWMTIRRDLELNLSQTVDQLACDATFRYPVGIIQSPGFPKRSPSCAKCSYVAKDVGQSERIMDWEYVKLDGSHQQDSGLGITVSSRAFEKQMGNNFRYLEKAPWLISETDGYCINAPPSTTNDTDIRWILSMVSLLKPINLGTGSVEMILYFPSSLSPPGDGFRIRYEATYSEQNQKALLLAYVGYTDNRKQQASIMSPKLTFTSAKCLTMVFISTGEVLLKAVTSSSEEQVLYRGLDTGASWSTAHFLLDGVLNGTTATLLLEFNSDAADGVVLGGVDRISVASATCRSLDFGSQAVTCDFQSECGYVDDSSGINRWIQYTERYINDTYMKAVLLTWDEGRQTPARLVSPPFKLSTDSCLTFAYKVYTSDIRLSVSVEHMETRIGKPSKVTQLQFEAARYKWHEVSLNVSGVGWRRLVFEAKNEGVGFSLARQVDLDEVRLAYKPCQENVSVAKPKENQALFQGSGDSQARLLQQIGQTDLRALYRMLGHQKDQMILECLWKGENCQSNSFINTYTDRGYCFTFNFNETGVLRTTETGAKLGARMILNIEQYEYTKEYSTDAGIRIHLHPQSDIARMNDLAIAVEPGSHSMASIKYQYALSLPSPWGNCTSESIKFFGGERFTQAKCKLSRETEYFVNAFGCKDIEMPGPSQVCNISKYITSMADLERITTRARRNLSCPDACVIESYSVELSSSLLSGLSTERLLSVRKQDIESRYLEATECRVRVTHADLVPILESLSETLKETERFETYLKVSVFGGRSSIVNRIVDGSVKMDELVEASIYNQMFKEIENYTEAYAKYKEPSITTVRVAYDQIATATTAFTDLVLVYNYRKFGVPSRKVQEVRLRGAEDGVTTAFSRWIGIVEDQNYTVKGPYLPAYISSNGTVRKECDRFMEVNLTNCRSSVERVIKDIEKVAESNFSHSFSFTVNIDEPCYSLDNVPEPEQDSDSNSSTSTKPCYSFWSDSSNVESLYENMRQLQDVTRRLSKCYSEYGDFLREINNWLGTVEMNTDFRLEENVNFLEMTQRLAEARVWLQQLMKQFMLNEKPLYDVAERINGQQKDAFLSQIDYVYNNIMDRVIYPLQQVIDERASLASDVFMKALTYHNRLSNYFADSKEFAEVARRLSIWRKVLPNLDSPQIISYILEPSETWKVWPNSKTYDTFVRDTAKGILDKIFGAYYNSLKTELIKVKNEVEERYGTVSTRFYSVTNKMNTYLSKLTVDDTFVRRNILRLDIFFGELKYEKVEQQQGYDIGAFFSDVGGYMGLFIGGSAITICELLDLVIVNSILKFAWKRKSESQVSTSPEHGTAKDMHQK